jgi:transposase
MDRPRRDSRSLGARADKAGHEVRLMPPAYVKPFVKRGKTDAADAEAVCEAATRPTMRFVPVKSPEQQAALSMHRTRDLLVKQRTLCFEGDPFLDPTGPIFWFFSSLRCRQWWCVGAWYPRLGLT